MSGVQTPYAIRHSGGMGEDSESALASPMPAGGVALPGSGFIVSLPQKFMLRSALRNALVSDACRKKNVRRWTLAETFREGSKRYARMSDGFEIAERHLSAPGPSRRRSRVVC